MTPQAQRTNGANRTDGVEGEVVYTKYDRHSLTYSNSFDNFWQRNIIRAIEWVTGKITIIRMVKQVERQGTPTGQAFWSACLDIMGIPLLTPQERDALREMRRMRRGSRTHEEPGPPVDEPKQRD